MVSGLEGALSQVHSMGGVCFVLAKGWTGLAGAGVYATLFSEWHSKRYPCSWFMAGVE